MMAAILKLKTATLTLYTIAPVELTMFLSRLKITSVRVALEGTTFDAKDSRCKHCTDTATNRQGHSPDKRKRNMRLQKVRNDKVRSQGF